MFIPANSDHAITNATFRVVFADTIPSKVIQTAENCHHLWKAELPAMRPAKTVDFGIMGNSAPQVTETRGIEFAFLRPDGSTAWLMTIVGHEILVTCSRYTRWEKVWPTAFSLIRQVLTVFQKSGESGSVASISLQVQDDFFWDSADITNYDLNKLFKRSSYISPICFLSDAVWHSHTGWFDNSEDTATLVRVEVTASRDTNLTKAKDLRAHVAVVNDQEVRFVKELQSVKDFLSNLEAKLSSPMETLHKQNKAILSELLTDEMATEIGLS